VVLLALNDFEVIVIDVVQVLLPIDSVVRKFLGPAILQLDNLELENNVVWGPTRSILEPISHPCSQ
jgi:hypothetical protein